MAPGAKKKNSNRKTIDSQSDDKKHCKNNFVDKQDSILNSSVKEQDTALDRAAPQDERYRKRGVLSNWQKYDEAPIDPHADLMRGKDFEVLVSYSGGSGSQLQLQDEKDWEEAAEDKSIALDIQDLVHVVKTVPFHKQLNLPTFIFTEAQLSRINSTAETWNKSYAPSSTAKTGNKSYAPIPFASMDSSDVKRIKKENFEIPESLDSSLNIIDNTPADEAAEPIPTKPILEEKTESIIESLASCLSLKTSVPEKKGASKEENEKETPVFTDDLDFLLSINVSLKAPVQEEKREKSVKPSVDDWLNSLLDE